MHYYRPTWTTVFSMDDKKGGVKMTLKSKHTANGLIEVRESGGGWYALYVNGSLKVQSADLNYIMREFDKL